MSISNETMKAIIKDYDGFELSDKELQLARPDVDGYFSAIQTLNELDLSMVMPSRLLRVEEGDVV
jgi:hypothetical protein